MTGELDDRSLAARFARQDDAGLVPSAEFELVRSRATQLERRARRRRLTLLGAAVVAALVAVPAIAVSRTLVERFFGNPADAEPARLHRPRPPRTARLVVRDSPRYVAGVRTTRGLVLLWAARRDDGTQCTGVEAAFGDADIVRLKLAGRTIADNGITCGGGPSPDRLHQRRTHERPGARKRARRVRPGARARARGARDLRGRPHANRDRRARVGDRRLRAGLSPAQATGRSSSRHWTLATARSQPSDSIPGTTAAPSPRSRRSPAPAPRCWPPCRRRRGPPNCASPPPAAAGSASSAGA